LRLVAVASDDRAPLAPDVPTARQAVFRPCPVRRPQPVRTEGDAEKLRARIAGDVRETLADAEVARRLTAMGYIPRTESTAELAAMLDRERVRWTEVARMYGAKPQQ